MARYSRNPQVLTATGGDVSTGLTYSWTTIADGNTTPDVGSGFAFKTANISAITITDFINGDPDGQSIKILFGDDYTTINHNANIDLHGGLPFTGNSGDMLEFDYDGSIWRESNRTLA